LTHRGVGPIQTVSLSVFRFDAPPHGCGRSGRWALARPATSGATAEGGLLEALRLGPRGRFTPGTDGSVWAILATWPDADTARDRIANARSTAAGAPMRPKSATLFLAPASARGRWSGREPFEVEDRTLSGPVAALTRATIRRRRLVKFWTEACRTSREIDADPNVLFKIGIGEVPFLHQVTFSVWPDTASMADFARRRPARRAIRAVREEGWFTEELYARFRVIDARGTGKGQTLSQRKDAA
jgi:spheroidene monooxygenase